MSNFLQCNDIRKTYREGSLDTEVLKGVSFEIEKGELVAIIGTSGSGKSTLLHILGALDDASDGSVSFLGQDLASLSSNKQAKLPLENVAMPLLIGGEKPAKAKEEAQRLLDKVGLSHRVDHRPSELSGGERQRVAIARALVNKPALVLADEPTGNLDHNTALSIYDLMRELNREYDTAFLVVTHDGELAGKMDRQLHMQDGLLVNVEKEES
ncbi:UNVERIFIED_CONTAM: hypothetical protein GTU68_030539 [Idotea baltica]|nr:hypothetical protein [Idotea baltica]